MHTHRLADNAKAAQCVARCRAGFHNEFEWIAWRKKHAKEIEALPPDLRNQVCLAWDNAGPKGT